MIRNLPEDVRKALALRAGIGHRSLARQAMVEQRHRPNQQAGQERRETVAAIRRDRAASGAVALPEALEYLIREDRQR
ncbi:MAG: hypothetical protein H6980_00480 [Gammaproteobacteria bacterium]|nr:hypothetical protein [Gammaproteobacteria bacterium]